MPIGLAKTAVRARARRRRWVLGVVTLLTLVGVFFGARHLWRRISLGWQVDRAVRMLSGVQRWEDLDGALMQWEAATRGNWADREPALIEHLVEHENLADPHIRTLLTWLTGCDYGARQADWRRWEAAAKHIAADTSITTRRLSLGARWAVPVGLTAWFSSILPLDGQVFVSSLGTAFDDATDEADGIVRVDASKGESEIFYVSSGSGRGARDIIGIGAAPGGLFIADQRGFVSFVERGGQVAWSKQVGAPMCGAPLVVDFNENGVPDAIVVTRAGNIVALSGQGGATVWVTPLATPPRPDAVGLGATLTLARPRVDGPRVVVATSPGGELAVVGVRDGRLLWRETWGAGLLPGACCVRGPRGADVIYVVDGVGELWELVPTAGGFERLFVHSLLRHPDETVIAGPRSVTLKSDEPPAILVCLSGDYATRRGAVAAVRADGVVWRTSVGGAVWGAPVVGDLDGDGASEVVVTTIRADAKGVPRGALVVLGNDGRILRYQVLSAPLECGPVLADLDGDARLEVLAADQAGLLHCFGTTGFGPVEWGLAGGDAGNTRNAWQAYSYAQRAYGLQWDWQVANE